MTSVRLLALVAASTLTLFSFALTAQAPAAAPPAQRGMMTHGMMAMPGMARLAGLPGELNQPIAGKPFTASAEVSYGQGQNSTVQMARDGEGRTYLHATLPARPAAQGRNAAGSPGPVEVIVIADPVAHKQYTIFPASKSIEVRPLRAAALGRGMISRGMMGRGMRRGTTTTLGAQKIAGQEAQGLKTEINVSARGNRPAMTMTREVWRSAAMGLILKASMTGNNRQMSFAVQALHTGTPDSTLFQLPAGYTLQSAPARAGRSPRRGTRPIPPPR